ncbi:MULTISPECIES: response regulator transcription factor [Auritidibacter]|uniref:response regulator transcription factor n=1 Tax=Auritidibacter TaxID=1160973 RepID=UPI000D7278CF|nr:MULTISPECIES: response regulator transcription factor [Auritidibacter]NIH72092.1 two-component system response regulator DesR [Auritidibacter ignavus]PXA79738.1 DNA-binding response regulator [Auritidibacter sp. NML120636]RMX23898.1 DNA-binding response regulator [Auritidibacter ignavus]WGH80745.1 response regulator transcription factor [Auritidibacter ignavus]WHS27075.1 response regulator transcription factor [Auritidibacter ignavus]
MIRVVLADDENLLRAAMAQILPYEGEIEVVAEAQTGHEAVEATVTYRPDVLVLDLEMPEIDGLEVLETIQQQLPRQPVLMLTRHAKPGVLRKALRLGVKGFESKSADPSHIADVIEAVHQGKRWIGSDVSASAVSDDCPLTEREKDVLRVTREGFSASEIAAKLFLSQGTVRNYLSSAIAKTHATNRHEAARFARDLDWI